jgi:ferredoxin
MARLSQRTRSEVRLRINPIACDGVGMCSHVAPDLITVDRWGYPVLLPEPVQPSDMGQAKAAVAVCPLKALFLEPGRES